MDDQVPLLPYHAVNLAIAVLSLAAFIWLSFNDSRSWIGYFPLVILAIHFCIFNGVLFYDEASNSKIDLLTAASYNLWATFRLLHSSLTLLYYGVYTIIGHLRGRMRGAFYVSNPRV